MESHNTAHADSTEVITSSTESLSPEKRTALDYQLNVVGEDFGTLERTLEWYNDEGDTATIANIHNLIGAFGEASTKDEEKQIAKQIADKLG